MCHISEVKNSLLSKHYPQGVGLAHVSTFLPNEIGVCHFIAKTSTLQPCTPYLLQVRRCIKNITQLFCKLTLYDQKALMFWVVFICILQDSILLAKWRNISWAIVCKVKFEVVGFIECNFRLVPICFFLCYQLVLIKYHGKKMKKWGVSKNGMPIGNSFFETPLNN